MLFTLEGTWKLTESRLSVYLKYLLHSITIKLDSMIEIVVYNLLNELSDKLSSNQDWVVYTLWDFHFAL